MKTEIHYKRLLVLNRIKYRNTLIEAGMNKFTATVLIKQLPIKVLNS